MGFDPRTNFITKCNYATTMARRRALGYTLPPLEKVCTNPALMANYFNPSTTKKRRRKNYFTDVHCLGG